MPRRRSSAVAVLVGLSWVACSDEEAQPRWDELDRSERIEFMTQTVLPVMRSIFEAHDPVLYADVRCETCHGDDMLEVDYRMPHALSPLPLEGTLETAAARNPVATQFMLDEVFPAMADMLDRDRYNEQSAPDGFRCVGCHVVFDG
jgi:hypothetical protein